MLIKTFIKIPIGICSIILTIFVLYLTLVPRPLPEGMPSWIGADKLGHFIFFITLTSCYLADAVRIKFPHKVNSRVIIAILLSSTLLSGGIELAQAYMDIGRSGSLADFIFDELGVIAAYILYKFWLKNNILKRL